MDASTLPAELLLQIFSLLDSRSFFAARNVCRSWHLASMEPCTLGKLLETMPISPMLRRQTLGPAELQCLSLRASRALMLDSIVRRDQEPHVTPFSTPHSSPANVPTDGCLVSVASRARRMAVFDGQNIRLYDDSTIEPKLLAERRLEERLGKGLWLKSCPLDSCKIALASNGHLLAIAFRSTIQVYDFSTDSSGCFINDSVATSNEHLIGGLEFEQRDHLLRVQISSAGLIVYLGSPPTSGANISRASFEHWTSPHGLHYRFLDCSQVLIDEPQARAGMSWLTGVQVLQPAHGGYLFAAQRHGMGQGSRYSLLHATCSPDPTTHAPHVDRHSFVEVARLESFPSSLDSSIASLGRDGVGSRETMPSTRISFPKFGLTSDGSMLLLAEDERKYGWRYPKTRLFVYRLPSQKRIATSLGKHEQPLLTPVERCRADAFRPTAQKADEVDADEGDTDEGVRRYTIPALPLYLGTIDGKVQDIAVEELGDKIRSYRFTVLTNEAVHSWTMDRVGV